MSGIAIESIQENMAEIPAIAPLNLESGQTQGVASAGTAFEQMVSNGLESVNGSLKASDAGLQDVAVGGAASLHQVMIQMEEAKLSLQLAVQVRNQLLSAYQDVMRMSI